MKIAQLTYSVKPRGGVVHTLEVSEALARAGHSVTIAALARDGQGFFRPPGVPTELIEFTRPAELPFDDQIEYMIDVYADGLRTLLPAGGFDVIHAQDCLSANAALRLRDAGAIGSVTRTVHHVDDFRSPSLIACQRRSILGPDSVLCVADYWVDVLERDFDVRAGRVTNGVDAARYAAVAAGAGRDAARAELAAGDRFVVLTIGGIEPRKGSVTLLEAFARLRELCPDRDPLLVIAGGETLFDYREEITRFHDRRDALGVAVDVRLLGPRTSTELDGLLAAADAFAFPSVKEGFGLVALEALASGLPLVTSDLDVFQSFLADGDSALLTPVGNAEALASALARVATDGPLRARLREGGARVVADFTWEASARRHLDCYANAWQVA